MLMNEPFPRRPGARLFLLISYLLWAAVALRWVIEFMEQGHPLTWLITLILLLYALLLGLEPWLTSGSAWRAHAYLALQTALVFGASLLYFELDFFALLLVPLCGQAMYILPRRAGLTWLAILITVAAVGLILQFGLPVAFSFVLLYGAALIFVAAFVVLVQEAETARRRSDALLAELQAANAQLQAYAGQAEELAVANERTRLARDLHDSVAQTLYGLTLQARAAGRQLSAGQTEEVRSSLAAIGEDALRTLEETRLLIYELRPPVLEQSGLSGALRARLEAVEARGDVALTVEIEPVAVADPDVETGLYRIAQEALNNASRHAGATELLVRLAEADGRLILLVRDNGTGFDPAAVPDGHAGLRGIAERVAAMNGRLTLNSAPGAGTELFVEVPV